MAVAVLAGRAGLAAAGAAVVLHVAVLGVAEVDRGVLTAIQSWSRHLGAQLAKLC